MQQMNNGQLPNNSFGFLFEFPKIILSLNDISNLMTTQYQQIQNNFEILFSLYHNYLGDSKDDNFQNIEMINNNDKSNDKIKEIRFKLINSDIIKKGKPYFKVSYKRKNKKRIYQVDCMSKKINVNFFKYMKENKKELSIDKNLLNYFKKNMKLTSKTIFEQLKKKFPKVNEYYEKFLKSNLFQVLKDNIKQKNDEEYSNLFFKHVKNQQKILNNDDENINEENVNKN